MLLNNRNEYTYVIESHSMPVLGCINSELNYRLCLNLFTLNAGIMEIHLLRYCFDCFSAGVLCIITMCMCVCMIISFGFCRAGHVLMKTKHNQ